MKTPYPKITATIGLVTGTGLLLALAGCVTSDSNRRGGYRSGPNVQVQTAIQFEDDYDYYPGYEVYYSRNRHEYVYLERDQWVRRAEPPGVTLNVLLASPSVRVDFRDSPERHHDSVRRSYPRNWQRTTSSIQIGTMVAFEDDYDYYPNHEVYYSRNRREYVYRDRNQWVRRSAPRDVSLNVLLNSPSVRVDFRDSPERHHDRVVRSYPKNWKRQDHRRGDRNDRRHDQRNRQDRKNDNERNDRDDDRR